MKPHPFLRRLIFILAIPVASFAAKPSPRPSIKPELDGYNANEIAFAEGLQAKGQIQVAQCYEIADMVLTTAGLPRLGYGDPVRGERMDLDRRGEAQSPPSFVDGVIQSRKPYRSVRVVAKAQGADWILNITREIKTGKKDTVLESSFIFTITSRMNQPSCDLKTINVQSGNYADQLDAHGCMAVLQLNDPSALALWIPNPDIHPWIKSDCQLGMHYFGSLKDLIADYEIKHIR